MRRAAVTLAILASLSLAACGDDEPNGTVNPNSSSPGDDLSGVRSVFLLLRDQWSRAAAKAAGK